jgi:carboxyl-terminal processing protease
MLLRVFAAVALLLALVGPARAEDLGPTSGERLLNEALDVTRDQWYDRHGRDAIDWDGLRDRYVDAVRTAASPLEAHHVVNRLLGELRTSHLALMEGDVYDRELASEFAGKRTARGGFELVRLGSSFFVSLVYEASPAAEAGLKTGDEVLSIDGEPAGDSSLLEEAGHDPGLPDPPGFVLKVAQDTKDVALSVRSERQGPAHEVKFAPTPTSMIEAAKASVRILERDGMKLGVVHLWHFMSSKMATVLKTALQGPLAHTDGLVLDVRGRGGHAAVIGTVLSFFRGERAIWKKPVVVLQDHGTRSAKEIFAWSWKRDHLGPIVGQRTAGAVIGCTFKRLFDGSVLMHPVQDVSEMTGVSLEGKGVDPDVGVDPGDLQWRAGRDPIFERGVEVLSARLAISRRYF